MGGKGVSGRETGGREREPKVVNARESRREYIQYQNKFTV